MRPNLLLLVVVVVVTVEEFGAKAEVVLGVAEQVTWFVVDVVLDTTSIRLSSTLDRVSSTARLPSSLSSSSPFPVAGVSGVTVLVVGAQGTTSGLALGCVGVVMVELSESNLILFLV